MKIFTKTSTLALMLTALMSLSANGETAENLYDFANNNLNLEVATPADWEDATKGVISGQEIRQGDVVLTSVDGAKVNRMWRTNGGVQYLQVGGKITITADAGRAIKSITFGVQNFKFFMAAQEDNGTLDNTDYAWTGNSTTVTFDNENAANEYNTQSLLLNMTVTTDDADADTYTPGAAQIVEAANIAQFKALEVGTIAKLMLNNTQVNAADWSTTYVEDETGAIEFDNINLGLATNDILNGYIIVKRSEYAFDDHVRIQAAADEQTTAETFTVTHDNQLIPTTFSIGDLLNDDNISMLVKIEDVSITKTGRFYYAADGDQQIMIQDAMFVLPYDFVMPENGEIATVTGIMTWDGIRYKIIITEIVVNETVAVTDINAAVENNAPVYTITGVNMGNTAVENLPAGIYVKAGKKFVVK